MDRIARREHLGTSENPNANLDYVISVSGRVVNLCRVRIRYVPDRVILVPTSLAIYLERLGHIPWTGLEEIAVAIVGDLNNELIPRWVQVTTTGISADLAHSVTLEDRQPKWDNPAMLARIRIH